MSVKHSIIILLLLLLYAMPSAAEDRIELPSIFQDTYIGATGGFSHFNYSNANLEPPFRASSVKRDTFGVKIYLGHYFNPYIAAQIGYMATQKPPQYNGITAPQSVHDVRTTFLNFTLKPTLPITDWLKLYGEGGVTTVSRKGFTTSTQTTVLRDEFVVSPLTGVGAIFRLNQNWSIDMGATYIWPTHSQPSTFFATAGLDYFFSPKNHASQAETPSRYYFPANVIEFGFFDRRLFNWNPSQQIPSPISFGGSIKLARGEYLMYERNFYHTERWFSFDWGISGGHWISNKNHSDFYTFSVFPAMRLWLIHSSYADLYLAYSIAGPAVLTRRVIDEKDAGSNFTFQDYLGIGMFLGGGKNLDLSLKLLHYSNGNVFPKNRGVSPPISFNIGYTW